MILLECSRICPFKWKRHTFICIYCNRSYADPAELREHNTQHEDIKLLDIKRAIAKISTTELIKADITDVSCKLCDASIDRLDYLITHLYDKHKKKFELSTDVGIIPFKMSQDDYRCTICNKQYEEYITLKHHMNCHYPNFICELCGSGFVTAGRLKVHAYSHETGSVPCGVCGKVFRSVNSKKSHYESVHMKLKRHSCPQCPETFLHHYQRLKHISSIHGMRVKEFKCDLCSKVFIASGKLYAHVRGTHLKEKKYACDVCDAKFFTSTLLKNHVLSHTSEKKFQCAVCQKAFKRKSTLGTHMRTHIHDKCVV